MTMRIEIEASIPLIVIEFVSGTGAQERDTTPYTGKFWVYEQGIGVPYYAIYDGYRARLEVHHRYHRRYQLLSPNGRGHYPIPPMRVELGLWQGVYQGVHLPWLRWWDQHGKLLLTGKERSEQERREKEQERREKEQERREKEQALTLVEQKDRENEALKARLRELGIDPNSL